MKLIAVLVLVCAAVVSWVALAGDPPARLHSAAPDRAVADDGGAVPGAKSGAPTRREMAGSGVEPESPGVAEATSTLPAAVELDLHGPACRTRLSEHVLRMAPANYTLWQQVCQRPGTGPAGDKTMEDAIGEMGFLLAARRMEAAATSVRDGSYVVFEAGSGEVDQYPVPKGSYAIPHLNFRFDDGAPRDVLVFVSDQHEMVAPILGEIAAMRRVQTGSDVEMFNSLPDGERRRRIEAHVAALEEAREIARTWPVADPRRQARFDDLLKSMLSRNVVVDRATWTIRAKS